MKFFTENHVFSSLAVSDLQAKSLSFFQTFLVEFSSYNEFLKLGQRICGVREKIMSKWCWTLFFVFHWITMASMGEISQNLSCLPLLETIFKYKIAIGFTLYMGLLVFFVLTTQLHDQSYMRRYIF